LSLIEYLRDLGVSHDRSHEVFVRSFWDAINNCEKIVSIPTSESKNSWIEKIIEIQKLD
jgi:hypothetical protein